MSVAVVLMLMGLWVAILLPGLLRARQNQSPISSVSQFQRNMDMLARTRCEALERAAEREIVEGPAHPSPADGPAHLDQSARMPRMTTTFGAAAPRHASVRTTSAGPTPAQRRRAVFCALGGVLLLSLLLRVAAPVVGSVLLAVTAAATVAYGYLVWQLHRRQELQRRVRAIGESAPVGRAPAGEEYLSFADMPEFADLLKGEHNADRRGAV